MRTSIGNYLRKLRMENKETLYVMAQKLNVSSAFLSAVENGKKKIPTGLTEKIEKIYSLTSNQIAEMRDAIFESSDCVEVNIRNVSTENRKLAITFARCFENLDDETAQKIIDVLKNKKEKSKFE